MGPTWIYCYGNMDIKGDVSTYNNIPGNLQIIMVPNPITGAAPGYVSLKSQAQLYAFVYAPQSDITMASSADQFGAVIGKTVTMTGGSIIHYDCNLVPATSGVMLVK